MSVAVLRYEVRITLHLFCGSEQCHARGRVLLCGSFSNNFQTDLSAAWQRGRCLLHGHVNTQQHIHLEQVYCCRLPSVSSLYRRGPGLAVHT